MPMTRPIVYVYQEYATLTVTPGIPDLNCVVVGPCYYIRDYPANKATIDVGTFVKSGQTMNAPCFNSPAGTSLGRPTPGANFLVTAPPDMTSAPGAVLDAASVEVVFDAVYIEKGYSTGAAITEGSDVVTVAGYDFPAIAEVGDRIVLTKASLELSANTVVKTIRALSATDDTVVYVEDVFTSAECTALGTTSIKFRVEHLLTDQVIDDAYWSVVGNNITITSGTGSGIPLIYNSDPYYVNYGVIYVGYRALRADKQELQTINDSTEIVSKLGPIDERNPLAVGVSVALSNTSTPIQAIGIATDDLTGQTAARDRISTRDDIYAIVPVTDSITGSSWRSVISMWQGHCETFADYTKSKFRIVIGSYDVLPTTKDSTPESDTGTTLEDPLVANTVNTVFIDPATTTTFASSEIVEGNFLELQGCSNSDMNTLAVKTTIFTAGYAPNTKIVRGVIGEKRIRIHDATSSPALYPLATPFAYAGGRTDQSLRYAIREPILKSEGVASSAIIVDKTSVTWAIDTGVVKLTKAGAFGSVAVGDVVHVSGGGTASHNDAFLVTDITGAPDFIKIACTQATGDTVSVQIYRPLASAAGCATVSTHITKSGAFTNVGIGDMVFILAPIAGTALIDTDGMWIVENKLSNDEIVLGGAPADASGLSIAIFRPVCANGEASVTVRRRFTRLQDLTQTFMTTVLQGEKIEIPHPADTDPTHFDTDTTTWAIATVVNNQQLDATLTELQELAPYRFKAAYSANMPYRISIDLDRAAQVTELITITTSLKSSRVVMTWPNECLVTDLTNAKTGEANHQKGQYLSCAVGGMVAGLPSHQGFTFIGIAGIDQIFNSNTYFTDAQISSLAGNGWYVFLQDSEASAPYSAHEVTTYFDNYEMGELMNVKNFDFISTYYKRILQTFLGRYNIIPETLLLIEDAFDTGTKFLKLRYFPKIGAPLLSASIVSLGEYADEADRLEIFALVDLPKVLNKIGLHLKA